MKTKLNPKMSTNSKAIILAIMMASIMLFAIPSLPATRAQATPSGVTLGGMVIPSTPWATTVPTGVTPNATTATTAWMSVSPNPIGVGQSLLVNVWVEPPVQTTRYHSGYTVTITKPDGTQVTVGPFGSFEGDTTGYFNYIPDQAGNYTFVFNFAGNYFPAGWYFEGQIYPSQAAIPQSLLNALNPFTASFSQPIFLQSAYYQPSTSPTTTINVQQAFVSAWPSAPFPGTDSQYFENGYWTFPISIDNREWWPIAGQYPFAGQGGGPGWPANTNPYKSNYAYDPYVDGPTSSHITWMMPAANGGIVGIAGGQYGERSIGSGETNYAGVPTIVFQGRCFQTITQPATELINGSEVVEAQSTWESYNLYTGQVYWIQTGITQPPTYVTQNLAAGSEPGAGQTGGGTGTWSLLFIGSSRYIRYDPWSGQVQLNISIPVVSGTMYNDPFVLSVQTLGSGPTTQYRLINWTTETNDQNFTDRIMSNITYPFASLGTVDYQSMVGVSTGSITPAGAGTAFGQFIMGASLVTGQLLWNVTTNDIFFSTSTGCADHGMYAVRCLGGFWDCWSLSTGQMVWQTPKSGTPGGEDYPWGDFGAYTTASYGGLLYDFSYAGIYAINWTNGQFAWHYVTNCVPFEAPWYPSMSLFAGSPQIANGILYYANGEHSPTEPLARGWHLYALNATTGQFIWDSLDGGPCGPVSGGYLFFGDNDMGYMIVFGPGQSATTVSAPQTSITAGTPAVISGAVLDLSPAQAGNACVSDASMTTWMSYLHNQQPLDGMWGNETVAGVPVVLTAVGPNGTVVNIGTVTTDVPGGTFGYTWTPTTTGQWKITATFAGDHSYGASSANTYATVVAAPVATTTLTPAPTTSTQSSVSNGDLAMYLVVGVIAIIVAIAIVGALLLRKRL